MPLLTLSARERADLPTPRTADYEWMSAATWRQKHEANVQRAAQGDCDILLLGDSITEGWNNNTLWHDRYPRLTIVNFGVGGDTTANLLWRIQNGELGKLKPRVVILMIGINNLGRNDDDPPMVVVGIRAIVSELQAKLPASKIVVLGLLPSGQEPKTKLRKQIKEVNRRTRRTLNDGFSIFVEDVGASMLEPDGTIAPETMADFLHPTPQGYQRLADAIFSRLDRLVGRL